MTEKSKSKKTTKGQSKVSSSKKAPPKKAVVRKTVIKLSGGKGNKPIRVSAKTTTKPAPKKSKLVGFLKGLLSQVKGVFSSPKKKRR